MNYQCSSDASLFFFMNINGNVPLKIETIFA